MPYTAHSGASEGFIAAMSLLKIKKKHLNQNKVMNTPTIREVEDWVMTLYNTCEETITDAERREQHKYATMVQRPQDKKFLVKMLDES